MDQVNQRMLAAIKELLRASQNGNKGIYAAQVEAMRVIKIAEDTRHDVLDLKTSTIF